MVEGGPADPAAGACTSWTCQAMATPAAARVRAELARIARGLRRAVERPRSAGRAGAGARTRAAARASFWSTRGTRGSIRTCDAFALAATVGATRHVVATKVDKLSRTRADPESRETRTGIRNGRLPVSATSGEGLDELWRLIARLSSQDNAAGDDAAAAARQRRSAAAGYDRALDAQGHERRPS